jgi:hypothetical protein
MSKRERYRRNKLWPTTSYHPQHMTEGIVDNHQKLSKDSQRSGWDLNQIQAGHLTTCCKSSWARGTQYSCNSQWVCLDLWCSGQVNITPINLNSHHEASLCVYVPADYNPESLLLYKTFNQLHYFLCQNAMGVTHWNTCHVWYPCEK